MIYPGLSKAVKRKPVGVTPMDGFTSQLFEPFATERLHPLDDLAPAPTLQDHAIVGASPLPLRRLGTPKPLTPKPPTPKPPTPKPSTPKSVEKKPDRGPTAQEVSALEAIAFQFSNSEINLPKILAEATIFIGVVLLNWSSQLAKPQRAIAGVKIVLVLVFLALHPVYSVLAVASTSCVYAYFKLAYLAKK